MWKRDPGDSNRTIRGIFNILSEGNRKIENIIAISVPDTVWVLTLMTCKGRTIFFCEIALNDIIAKNSPSPISDTIAI